jgi:photosystem II stability/assembly factor-like uncharacterized protein
VKTEDSITNSLTPGSPYNLDRGYRMKEKSFVLWTTDNGKTWTEAFGSVFTEVTLDELRDLYELIRI